MAKEKPGRLEVKSFADHHVITQPNPLRKVLLRVPESDLDDPVGRAEKALAGLSGEFKNWMTIEADRLSAAHAAVLRVQAGAAAVMQQRGDAGLRQSGPVLIKSPTAPQRRTPSALPAGGCAPRPQSPWPRSAR